MVQKWALILASLDDLVFNNYNRRFETYLILGWETPLIKEYLDKKENALQIASFNTPIVTFTASSRRNRFYDIYDRPSLLNKDVAWQSVIPMLTALRNTFDIFIISARPVTQKEITLEMMKKFGF